MQRWRLAADKAESESECKCLTCNQKPTGSQFSLLHEPKFKVNGKNKNKTTEQSSIRKGSPMKGVGLWREGFKEKVSFEFRVEK